eukprot:2043291-Pleurochrysis_carterae.AAC.1
MLPCPRGCVEVPPLAFLPSNARRAPSQLGHRAVSQPPRTWSCMPDVRHTSLGRLSKCVTQSAAF